MTSKTIQVEDVITPDRLAVKIAEKWISWDNMRSIAKTNWEEIRRYVYATDTTQTTNSKLPWKNKTTVPKLCQISDNLLANYTATLFPQRKWLIWEANERDANSVAKRDAITNYMNWSISQPSFKHELEKIIIDYIHFGNCFATVEWVDERLETPDGVKAGYVGPVAKRVSPLDTVFNPTTENFVNSPKIIRSIISKGDLKKMLESLTDDGNRAEYEEIWTYLKEIRNSAMTSGVDWVQKDALFAMDGFSSFRNYLQSDFVELLTFYGDLYDDDNDELLQNYVIMCVDRHKLIGKKANPSFFGTPPIFHTPWRKKQDNLWGMGPLDNLVGMQYRIDHLENMKADILDLVTYPVIKVKGFVENFTWQPGEIIYIDNESDVELLSPEVQALNIDLEIERYERSMEEKAGAPREAMGFRTPGEKTKYEVQSLENAAARVFQNKIKQFEEQLVEPLLNAMLELARRNLVGTTAIKVFDDEFKVASFEQLSAEDITGIGRIKPVAARHFAEQAELVQNISNLAASGLWQTVQPHFSSVKLAKIFEHIFNLEDYEVVLPYVALSEQAEAQKFSNSLQQGVVQHASTPTGMGQDFDLVPPSNQVQVPQGQGQ